MCELMCEFLKRKNKLNFKEKGFIFTFSRNQFKNSHISKCELMCEFLKRKNKLNFKEKGFVGIAKTKEKAEQIANEYWDFHPFANLLIREWEVKE